MNNKQIFAVIKSIIASSMAEQRLVRVDWGRVQLWRAETLLLDGGCGADSLEMVNIATELQLFFQLAQWDKVPSFYEARTLGDLVQLLERNSPDKLALGFQTSGTTGEKKLAVHDLAALEQEAEFFARHFKGTKRVVSLVPAHHLYGFIFTILLPEALGVDVLDAKALSSLELVRALSDGDLLVGFPSYWKVLKSAGLELPQGVKLVSSTEACPDGLKHCMMEQLGAQSFVEVYGSSETSGVGWRAYPDTDYQLLPGWRKRGEALVKLSHEVEDAHPLMDAIQWCSEDTFTVGERLDGQVQVAGKNVSLREVEQVLSACSAVKACAVRSMSKDEGAGLKAYIVSPDDVSSDRQEEVIRAFISDKLEPYKCPKHYTFGNAIPKNQMGKLMDWSIHSDCV